MRDRRDESGPGEAEGRPNRATASDPSPAAKELPRRGTADGEDPFAEFREWEGPADERAFGDL